jgi:hypothetical protein
MRGCFLFSGSQVALFIPMQGAVGFFPQRDVSFVGTLDAATHRLHAIRIALSKKTKVASANSSSGRRKRECSNSGLRRDPQ